MAVTPSTELRLLKCNLNLDNNNQLTFSNSTAQYNYFNSLTHKTVTQISYQRKDSYIRFPEHIDNLIEYNYVMYKNSNYSNKWFYAYVTRMEYENDNCTRVYIETDVWQTWQFDLTFMKSFVEREHVNDDTVGKHTVPENLETGDYISTYLQPSSKYLEHSDMCFAVASTIPATSTSYVTTSEILPTGVYYAGFTSLQGIHDYISHLDSIGAADSVVSVFVIPKYFFSSWGSVSGIDGSVSTTVSFYHSETITIPTVNYLGNNYTPKNKKLLTFPYSFLQVSNHAGQVVDYRWENFNTRVSGNSIQFTLHGSLTPSGSYTLFPIDYNNILNNYDDGMAMGKLPIGGYQNDSYTNWLVQNGASIAMGIGGGAISTIVGATEMIGSGGAAGGTTTIAGIGAVAGTLAQVYQHSFIPPQANGNVAVGDVMYADELIGFEFTRKSIKNEYAKIIDDFFTMYGYKVNSLKTPNITGRSNWNYVKLINPNIEGYIPQEDLEKIKEMFTNGITLWHTTSHFLDYSQNNSII